MQQHLLENNLESDYFIIESIFKGNFLIKDEWRRNYASNLWHQTQTGYPTS